LSSRSDLERRAGNAVKAWRWGDVTRRIDEIRALLADPATGVSPDARLPWQRALTVSEVVGEQPSLP
jgi:hypothetical protein